MLGMSDLESYVQDFQANLHKAEEIEQAQKKLDEFLKKYPKEKLKDMTLDEFCLGKGEHSFCWWLEFGSTELGGIGGGSAKKHFIFYSRKKGKYVYPAKDFENNDNKALEFVKKKLIETVELMEEERIKELDNDDFFNQYTMLSRKTCYLYNHKKLLPFYSEDLLDYFVKKFLKEEDFDPDELNEMGYFPKNVKLLEKIRSNSLFNDWETFKISNFLYSLKMSNVWGDNGEKEEKTQIFENIKEKEIQKIIANSISSINWYLDEEVKLVKKEFDTEDVGKIDFLLKGEKNYYVVELKSGTAHEAVVGQILRYIGSLNRKDEFKKKGVKGIILAEKIDANCKCAIEPVSDFIMFRSYNIKTEIRDPKGNN
jgi:Endonuclease NucS C-terminal domain